MSRPEIANDEMLVSEKQKSRDRELMRSTLRGDQPPALTDPIRTAVISSTARDLPDHRREVEKACREARFFPNTMEELPASDTDAVNASMQLVNAADVYIGVFGHRYGYVPKGSQMSITEMELERALERNITILPFLMDPAHPITEDMVERSKAAQRKLEKLKARASAGRIRKLFRSAADLRALVISALKELRLADMQRRLVEEVRKRVEAEERARNALAQLHERAQQLERLLASTPRKSRDGPESPRG